MDLSRLCAAAALLMLVAHAPVAAAQNTAFPVPVDTTCRAPAPTLDADTAAMDAMLTAARARGYQGLREHLSHVQAVAAHTPACYPEIQQEGDRIIVRTMGDTDIGALTLALLASAATERRALQVVNERNLYAEAFLYLGSYGVEFHNYDEALQWLDRGLALQPNNQSLMYEKGAALSGARRYLDAANLYQSMIDNLALSLTLDEAKAYRALGIALIDVPGRLDDAEAALTRSLSLEPDNPSTQNELQYIADLRGGGAQRELELTAPMSQADGK